MKKLLMRSFFVIPFFLFSLFLSKNVVFAQVCAPSVVIDAYHCRATYHPVTNVRTGCFHEPTGSQGTYACNQASCTTSVGVCSSNDSCDPTTCTCTYSTTTCWMSGPEPSSPPGGFCGDGVCNNGENCGSCSGDCGACSSPPSCSIAFERGTYNIKLSDQQTRIQANVTNIQNGSVNYVRFRTMDSNIFLLNDQGVPDVNKDDLTSPYRTLILPQNQGTTTIRARVNMNGTNNVCQATATINITPPDLPSVDLKINNSDGPVTLTSGTYASLSWTTTNVLGNCTATSSAGDFTGSKAQDGGPETVSNLNSTRSYTLTCSGYGGTSASDTVNVNVPVSCQAVSNITVRTNQCASNSGLDDGSITWEWNESANADQYLINVLNQSNTTILSQTVSSSNCTSGRCSFTASGLEPNNYRLSIVASGSSCSPNSAAIISQPEAINACTYQVSGTVYLYNEEGVTYDSDTNRCTLDSSFNPSLRTGFGGAQISIGGVNVTTAANGSYSLNPTMTGGAQAVSLSNIGTNLPLCPSNGVFSITETPTTGLDFYISAQKDPWFQVEGGDIHSNNDSKDPQTLVFYNPVSIACLLNTNCKPYTIVRSDTGQDDTSGFLTYGSGRIDSWSNTGNQTKNVSEDDPDSNTVRIGQSFMQTPRETFGYLYRLHEFGLNPPSYYSSGGRNPNAAGEPIGGASPAYFHSGNIRITSAWNVTAGDTVVLFVDGNVSIENELIVSNGGFLAIVASGNITFSENVDQAQGVFIADNQIIVEGNDPSTDNQFVGEGSFVGWNGINFDRDLANNNATPAVLIRYRADLVQNAPQGFKTKHYRWQEVAP